MRERLSEDTRTVFTLRDLEQMPDDAIHRELVNGELIELPPRDIAQAVTRSISMYGPWRMVALLNYEQGNASFACTGVLINSNSLQPFLLTSNECVGNTLRQPIK